MLQEDINKTLKQINFIYLVVCDEVCRFNIVLGIKDISFLLLLPKKYLEENARKYQCCNSIIIKNHIKKLNKDTEQMRRSLHEVRGIYV